MPLKQLRQVNLGFWKSLKSTARHKFANQDMMIKHVPEKLSNKLPQESGADESREVLKNISMNGI